MYMYVYACDIVCLFVDNLLSFYFRSINYKCAGVDSFKLCDDAT